MSKDIFFFSVYVKNNINIGIISFVITGILITEIGIMMNILMARKIMIGVIRIINVNGIDLNDKENNFIIYFSTQ